MEGACFFQPAGEVVSTMLKHQLYGPLLSKGATALQDRRAGAEPSEGAALPLPRTFLLAATRDALHVLATNGSMKVDAKAGSVSYDWTGMAGATYDERKLTLRLRIDLVDGRWLEADTKRIGANRKNIDVCKLIEVRAGQAPS